jgi:hypothetical protein
VLAQRKAQLTDNEDKIPALENLWNRAEQSKDIGRFPRFSLPPWSMWTTTELCAPTISSSTT